MVLVKINGVERYIDGYLKNNLDNLNELVVNKWDGVGFVTGYEGDGKSWIANQIAAYLDPTYNIDRCVFTAKQFLDAVDNAKPFQCIVFDEAHAAFSNTNRYDEINKLIITKLTMIRKKQLFLIIIAPTFFDLRKYLVIHRSRFVIHAYANGIKRGFFRFFNREKKHKLFIFGKKNEDMYSVSPNFIGCYTAWFPLDEEEYERKKDEATLEIKESNDKLGVRQQRNKMFYYYFKEPGRSVDEISALIGLDSREIRRYVKKIGVLKEGGGEL